MNNNEIERKRSHEIKILKTMCAIYCHGNHNTKGDNLCNHCCELFEYAMERTNKCPFIETKTFCSACKIHCYRMDRQEQIRLVMKYAGPRILFTNPLQAFKHMTITIKQKRKK